MNITLVVGLLIALFLFGCGRPHPTQSSDPGSRSIRNGREIGGAVSAVEKTVGFVRAFSGSEAEKHIGPFLACSGTLIEPRVILTAAHCVVTRGLVAKPAHVDVRLNGATFRARSILVHSNYFQRQFERGPAFRHPTAFYKIGNSDIALIGLSDVSDNGIPSRSLQVAVTVVPPSVPAEYVEILGFGLDESNQGSSIGRLRSGNTRVTAALPLLRPDLTVDGQKLESIGSISSTDQYACPGDSGGPMIQTIGGTRFLIGVSQGLAFPLEETRPCGRVLSNTHTSTAFHQNWIMGNARRLRWELRADADGNGKISDRDALVIIQKLDREQSTSLSLVDPRVGEMEHSYDVTGDGRIQPIDALVIINYLRGAYVQVRTAGQAVPR